VEQLRRHPGRSVERLFVVPSALRSLSVVMLLGAVSGTVIATTPHAEAPASDRLAAAELDLSGRIALASSSTPLSGGVATADAALTGTALAASPLAGLHTAAQRQAAGQAAAVKIAAEQAAEKAKAEKQAEADKKKAAAKAKAEKKAAAERKARAKKKASRNSPRSSQAIAKVLVAQQGWKSGQYSCLVKLWTKESGWRHTAANPSSSAYGIPQALPGSKMSSAGKDWRSNPATQIKWGLGYIEDRYGSPCSAWAHSRSHNWY
jgi:hypothetical protein